VSLSVITDIEDYRDGYSVPGRGWDGQDDNRTGERPYSGFRLYATNLEALPMLVKWLTVRGIRTYSSVDDVVGLRTLDRSLGTVLLIILGIGSAGVLVSLASVLWAHVERRRRELSIIRLMGAASIVLVGIPILEALIIGLSAILVSVLGYAVSDLILGLAFRAPGLGNADLCWMPAYQWAIAVAGTLACASSASILAAWKSLSIPPAEGFE
jgi:putative ABC transport system permease protein